MAQRGRNSATVAPMRDGREALRSGLRVTATAVYLLVAESLLVAWWLPGAAVRSLVAFGLCAAGAGLLARATGRRAGPLLVGGVVVALRRGLMLLAGDGLMPAWPDLAAVTGAVVGALLVGRGAVRPAVLDTRATASETPPAP